MSSSSWILEETTLPKLGCLGQGDYGYISLVRTPDGMLMAKKTSLRKYSENLEKELRILHHFNSINFKIVRPTSPLIYHETMPVNVKVSSIYMEVAPHGSLKDMLTKAGGRLPENVVGYCTLMILKGLKDLHQAGYVHCDLRLENILIFKTYTHGELCELKLADFGLSKEPNGPIPLEGSLFEGSPDYLAPEAVGPDRIISPAVDIWSLGVMVVKMLGPPPIVMLRGRVIFLSEVLSSMAFDFVSKCTVRDPAGRATAEDLLSHPFVRQSIGVPPVEMLPVPACLSDGVVQGRFI
ncbi:PREDICTED: serine/threonine-protein kinase PAK 4-like [Camelina sativa]|uniref:Serine/threonine-protein kinase PAK 4-like n=1 Tax=Camelina sativa TaxID=90675 RepID=A0ABM0YXK0_CAMSA|nr:PREDICTED: serine/threonine-protein kinase PAK 4-like [Camelina sativa]